MFEKEAEEYAEINKPFLNRYDCVCVFKDGATFGYNKANEWHEIESKVTPNREISKQYMPKNKVKE